MTIPLRALPSKQDKGRSRKTRQATSALWSRLKGSALKFLSPAKPVLKNLAQIPFTVAGWGLISAAAFQLNLIVGLAATGVILMVLEHQIADE